MRLRAHAQSYPTQQTFFAYWSVLNGYSSSIVLNNPSNIQLTVRPTLYNLSGSPLAVTPITLSPRQQVVASIDQWVAGQSNFSQGNLNLSYEGPEPSYLGSQVTVSSPAASLSFDVPATMPANFAQVPPGTSPRLEGLWWRVNSDSHYNLVLSNTTGDNVNVTVAFTGNPVPPINPPLISPDPVWRIYSLLPHQTQVVNLDNIPELFAPGIGGVSITYAGLPGAVIAYGMQSNFTNGFSSQFSFTDPLTAKSATLAGEHLLIGSPDIPGFSTGTSFSSIALMRNTSASPIAVTPKVSSVSGSTPQTVALPVRALLPQQVDIFDVGYQLSQAGVSGPFVGAGLTLSYVGAPGSLVAHLTSYDQTQNYSFDVPMKDPAVKMNHRGGSYPWSLAGDNRPIIHIRNNAADQPSRVAIQLDFNGTSYTLPMQRLAPQQEVAIDIRQLRDSQTPDSIGRVIPLSLMSGQANWNERGPQLLIGRLEVFSVSQATANSFSCPTNCCSPSYDSSLATPGFTTGVPGDSFSITVLETDYSCGQFWGPYDMTGFCNFSTDNPSAIQISGNTVTLTDEGSATIYIDFTAASFTLDTEECVEEPCEFTCTENDFSVRDTSSVTVVKPELVGVVRPAVAGDDNSIVSGQQFTLQIQAQVPGTNRVDGHFNSPVSVSFNSMISGESISQTSVPMSMGVGQTQVVVKVIDQNSTNTPSCCRTYALASDAATSTTGQVRVWFSVTMDIERWKNCNFSSCPNLGSYFCTSACVTGGFSTPYPFVALTSNVCGANLLIKNRDVSSGSILGTTVLDLGPSTNSPYWNNGNIPSIGGCISDSLADQLGVSYGCNPNVGQGNVLWRFQ